MKKNVTFGLTLMVCLCGFAALLQRLSMRMYAIRYVHLIPDPQISHSVKSRIKKIISRNEYEGSYQPYVLVSIIKQEFPYLKEISARCIPHHVCELFIEAYDPILRINEKQLLLANRMLVSHDYYAAYVQDKLPCMYIPTSHTKELNFDLMHTIDLCFKQSLFDHFTITMKHFQEWYLVSKEDKSVIICCNPTTMPNVNDLKRIDNLKQEMSAKKSISKPMLADIRFDKQIIISSYKGGLYGKES